MIILMSDHFSITYKRIQLQDPWNIANKQLKDPRNIAIEGLKSSLFWVPAYSLHFVITDNTCNGRVHQNSSPLLSLNCFVETQQTLRFADHSCREYTLLNRHCSPVDSMNLATKALVAGLSGEVSVPEYSTHDDSANWCFS